MSRLRPQPEHTTWWWWTGLAGDVGVLAVRQVDALHHTDLGQHVQRSEDGRPADPEASCAGLLDDVRGREVTGLTGDQGRDLAARFRHPVSGAFESGEEGCGVDHPGDRTSDSGRCRY